MNIHNLIILDASGSMDTIYHDTLNGVNQTIQSIRCAQEENPAIQQRLSLALFSGPSQIRFIYKSEYIQNVPDLSTREYIVGGLTALYDAIGYAVDAGVCHFSDAVLVTIITDGRENASERWTRIQIKVLVESLQERGWTFTYIGANQNASFEASKIGIKNSHNFRTTPEETREMFDYENERRDIYYSKMSNAILNNENPQSVTDYFDEGTSDKVILIDDDDCPIEEDPREEKHKQRFWKRLKNRFFK